jgi:hypothetical protein
MSESISNANVVAVLVDALGVDKCDFGDVGRQMRDLSVLKDAVSLEQATKCGAAADALENTFGLPYHSLGMGDVCYGSVESIVALLSKRKMKLSSKE